MSCPHATRLIEIGQGADFTPEERETLVSHLQQSGSAQCAECKAQIEDPLLAEPMHEALVRMQVGEPNAELDAEIRAHLGKPEGRG